MVGLAKLHEHGKEIESRLKLKSAPLAVRVLKQESDIPRGAIRPLRDLGYHLATCQAFTLSRHSGETFALLLEDMWCFESALGFGLAEIPESFLNGENAYPGSSRTPQSAATWAREEFPHLESGKYIGVASAPLETTNFLPDVVVIYCDSAQLTQLVLSAVGGPEGRDVACKLSGRGACVYEVVPSLLENKYHLAVPCPGDRNVAMAQDNELAFSLPVGKIDDLVEGLRHLDELGIGFFRKLKVRPEYQLHESYVKIGREIGMDVQMKKDGVAGDTY